MGKQRRWMPRNAYARAGLLVFASASVLLAANWVRLLNAVGLDNLLERQLLSFASHTVDRSIGESIRLVYIKERGNSRLKDFVDDAERQCWRAHLAELLRKLDDADAAVVAFDLVFPPAIEDCAEQNARFVEALRSIRQEGRMQVILGYDAAADLDPAIASVVPAEDMALVRVARQQSGAQGPRYLTSVLLAEADEIADAPGTVLTRPVPLPLAAYMAVNDGWPPDARAGVLPADRLVTFTPSGRGLKPVKVDVRSCTASALNCPLASGAVRHWYSLLPVWMGDATSFIERSFASVALQDRLGADYAGKIVLIGARTPEEAVVLDPESRSATAWGYQIHARALADLMSGTYLRRPSGWAVLGFLLALGALGIVAQLWLPKLEVKIPLPWVGNYPIPLGLVLIGGAHGFVMILLLRHGYWLHDIGYQWLALAAGFYLASRPLQGSRD